jgi:hypothetical protein
VHWAADCCVLVGAELTTMLDSIADDGRQRPVQKPKMEIILGKSEQFDQIMAEASRTEQTAEEPSGEADVVES